MAEPETTPPPKEKPSGAVPLRLVVATTLFCVFWPLFFFGASDVLQAALSGATASSALSLVVDGVELLLFLALPISAIVGFFSCLSLWEVPTKKTGVKVFIVFTLIIHVLAFCLFAMLLALSAVIF